MYTVETLRSTLHTFTDKNPLYDKVNRWAMECYFAIAEQDPHDARELIFGLFEDTNRTALRDHADIAESFLEVALEALGRPLNTDSNILKECSTITQIMQNIFTISPSINLQNIISINGPSLIQAANYTLLRYTTFVLHHHPQLKETAQFPQQLQSALISYSTKDVSFRDEDNPSTLANYVFSTYWIGGHWNTITKTIPTLKEFSEA